MTTELTPRIAQLLAAQHYTEVIPLLKEETLQHPQNMDLLAYLAGAYLESGQPEEAQALTLRVLSKAPGHIEALIIQGSAHFQQGDFQAAFGDLQKAYERDPSRADVLLKLAHIYASEGYADRAIALYEQLIFNQPGFFMGHFNAGVLYAKTGEFEDALEAFEAAIELEPEDTDALVAYAQTLVALQRFTEAIETLDYLLNLDERLDALYLLYVCHLQLGHYAEAEALMRDLLDAAPEQAALFQQGLARVYLETGQLEEAKELLQKSLAKDPHDADTLYLMGTLYHKEGKNELAQKAFRKGIKIAPEHAELKSAVLTP